MKPRFFLATILFVVVLTSCTSPAVTQPSDAALSVIKFEEGECPFNVPDADTSRVQCGYVIVPENYNDPSGPTIRLAVGRLKNQSSARQPDPVIILAGGPGEKILTAAPSFAALLAPMIGERDLIVFDQRGVGLSQPALECPEWLQAAYDQLDESDAEVSARLMFEAEQDCRDRLIGEGINLSNYNTVQNAADVNAIRLALGYDQVNLFGGSYGSLLAQAVMRDHPQAVRSVVLASTLPLEKSFFVDVSTTSAKAVLHLLDACASDTLCNTTYPDLKTVLLKTIDDLNSNPVPVTLTNPVDGKQYAAVLTGDAIFGNLVGLLYHTDLIPILPRAIYDISKGDYTLMTQLMGVNVANFDAVSRGMMFSVFCADDLIGRTEQEYLDNRLALPEQLVNRIKPDLTAKYGPFATCRMWSVQQADPSVKQPVVSDIPTLVLEGEFDPVTPPEYGQLVASYLPNSTFYNFPNAGHNVVTTVECARQVARAFFDDPIDPPEVACTTTLSDVTFDVPGEAAPLKLIPYTDEERGFSGLIPEGWKNLQSSNLVRGRSALDPAYFVLEAQPGSAADLFDNLTGQLQMDPKPTPIKRAEVGNFTWDFYTFERRGNPVDVAIAEDGEKAYFVFVMSPLEEHETFYAELFMPAVKAMAALK
jgi:pimeloyl-ACP methyl ester carboxylesterase